MTDGITAVDRAHNEAMRQGSEELRNRIYALLSQRDAKFSAMVKRHSAARRAIAGGIDREKVQSLFDLSDTAYDDLAGQVRAGCRE